MPYWCRDTRHEGYTYAGKVGGFSLHAGVAAEAHGSPKLERLCGYIKRLCSGCDSHQPQAHRMSALQIQFVERHD